MEITITEWNDNDSRGRGIHHGKAALIAQAYPGDTIIARIDKSTRGTLQGRVSRIVTPSPDRVKHPCPHIFRCTGCAFVALAHTREDQLKAERVRTIIHGIAPEAVETIRPLLRPTEPFYYRHYAKQIVKWQSSQPVVGAYVMGTHSVVDNTDCPVLTEDLSRVMLEIKRGIVTLEIPIHRDDQDEPMRSNPSNPNTVTMRRDHRDPTFARMSLHTKRTSSERTQGDERKRNRVRFGDDAPATGMGIRYVIARQSRATSEVLVLIVTSNKEPRLERQLCRMLKDRLPYVRGAHLVINADMDSNALLAGSVARVAGDMAIHDDMLGYKHRIGPTSFFQVNPQAATVLFQEAIQAAIGTPAHAGSTSENLTAAQSPGGGASPKPGSYCIEAYAGVGALTLPLSDHFERVVAIESTPEAVKSLRITSHSYDRDERIEVRAGQTETELPALLQQDRVPDVVVLDPPRKGMGEVVVRALAESKVKRIVLLSCEPTTLHRDLSPLLAAGFRIERVVPVDQFPRTHHVETVTCLVRERDGSDQQHVLGELPS